MYQSRQKENQSLFQHFAILQMRFCTHNEIKNHPTAQEYTSPSESCHPNREVWAGPSSFPRKWHDTSKVVPHLNLIFTTETWTRIQAYTFWTSLQTSCSPCRQRKSGLHMFRDTGVVSFISLTHTLAIIIFVIGVTIHSRVAPPTFHSHLQPSRPPPASAEQ